jgi:hypothetical protein
VNIMLVLGCRWAQADTTHTILYFQNAEDEKRLEGSRQIFSCMAETTNHSLLESPSICRREKLLSRSVVSIPSPLAPAI